MEPRRILLSAFFLVVCFSGGYTRAPSQMRNGRDALIEDFPSNALLWMDGWRCGGIIYDEKHILTVGHCVAGILSQVDLNTYEIGDYNVYIVAGASEYGPEHNPEVEFAIEKMILHPEYRTAPMIQNDIGIIKLKKPITFNKYRRPMKRPEGKAPESGDAVATGWTKVADRKFVLQQASMHIEPRDVCSPHYQPQLESQMCAKPDLGAGPCIGDSGSPLIFNGGEIGMISVGVPLCEIGFPLVYTHIHSFLDWINEVVAS